MLTSFARFDDNGDGKISPAEFRRGINSLDIELPGTLLAEMINALGTNKLDNVWRDIDQDGSGDLSPEEFAAVMATMDPTMTPAAVSALARKLDRNRDGSISQDEYRDWFLRQPVALKEKVVTIDYRNFVSQFDPFKNDLQRLFDDLDQDGGGTLDRRELQMLCQEMGVVLSERELSEAMRDMDDDRSGEVDFEEFFGWMNQSRKSSRKFARAVAEYKAKRDSGAVRQAAAFGRPSQGDSGADTEAQAANGYLPHCIRRKEARRTNGLTQLDPQCVHASEQHPTIILVCFVW